MLLRYVGLEAAMRPTFATSLFYSLLILAVSIPVSAEDFTGQVVGIIDGDTIQVMHLGQPETIVLHGIDCPELDQPHGERAKQYTYTHTFRKTVSVIVHDTDSEGRTLGQVILPDMSNLNLTLVSAGLAWWHGGNTPEDQMLEEVEKSARTAGRGLWADPDPVPPWEWGGKSRTPSP